MTTKNEFVDKLKYLQREVLDLKQAKKASCASKYFVFINPAQQSFFWLITYEDGKQPIITEALSYMQTSLSTPSNNTQYLFAFSQTTAPIVLLSTRKILKVEVI